MPIAFGGVRQNRHRPSPDFRSLCGRITGHEYDKKGRELKERQTEIALRIEQHQKGEGDYRITLVDKI